MTSGFDYGSVGPWTFGTQERVSDISDYSFGRKTEGKSNQSSRHVGFSFGNDSDRSFEHGFSFGSTRSSGGFRFGSNDRRSLKRLEGIKDRFEKFDFESEAEMRNLLQDLEVLVKLWIESPKEFPELDEEISENIKVVKDWKDIDKQVLVDHLLQQYDANNLGPNFESKIHVLQVQLPKLDKSLKKLSLVDLEKKVIEKILEGPLDDNLKKEITDVVGPLLGKQKIEQIKKSFKWEYLPFFSKRRDFMSLSFKEIVKKAWELNQENIILKDKLQKDENQNGMNQSFNGVLIPSKPVRESPRDFMTHFSK